jgi:hypothetical protein
MAVFLAVLSVVPQAVANADDLAVNAEVIDVENVPKAVCIAISLVATAEATQLNIVDCVLVVDGVVLPVVWAKATKPIAKVETTNAETIIFLNILVFLFFILPTFVLLYFFI